MALKSVSSSSKKISAGRHVLMAAIMIAIVLIAIEMMSFVAANRLKNSGVFYDPATVKQSYDSYLAKRDLVLGWGRGGPRSDPVFPVTAEPCVSLFGDSFTQSSEVEDRDAWGSVLATKLGCRVANYGVGGYGSDQAYLRYRSLPPKGTVVFLNHLSENIIRNVNQFRHLIRPGSEFSFKPRFVYKDDAAKLIETPQISPNLISNFKNNPASYLHNEYFLPGGSAGNQIMGFPYSVALFKAILWNQHLRARLQGKPQHADFYRPQHESQALEVTYEIIRAFAKDAARRGQLPIVTIIPTCDDFIYFNRNGAFPYIRLKKMIVTQNIRLIDFGEEIMKRLRGSSPENLYHGCYRHFNESGYRYLANIAFDYLKNDPKAWRRLTN